jgi:hypothetical protein
MSRPFRMKDRRFRKARGSRSTATVIALALLGPASAQADPAPPPVSERAPEVRLTGKVLSLPIVLVGEYPFVEGSISGVAGKLMLDTGYQGALTVNTHRVPVQGGRAIGTGFFGSGQTFAIQLVPALPDVRIGALAYRQVTNVTAQDARMLEAITPDFLGWLGHHAFASHALKLDYKSLRATFYGADGPDYLVGERVVAQLSFETRQLPNHPIMKGRVGDMDILTRWDTGQYGSLYTSEAGKARLLKSRRLTPSAKADAFDLHGLQLGGHPMPVLTGISVETQPSSAAKPIGITEPDELVIGYALLDQFKTVWDYPRRRLYLLKP